MIVWQLPCRPKIKSTIWRMVCLSSGTVSYIYYLRISSYVQGIWIPSYLIRANESFSIISRNKKSTRHFLTTRRKCPDWSFVVIVSSSFFSIWHEFWRIHVIRMRGDGQYEFIHLIIIITVMDGNNMK